MSYYKKKDLVSTEIVVLCGAHDCVHCGERIKKKDNPVAFKFFSKKTVHTHYKCKEAFNNTLS